MGFYRGLFEVLQRGLRLEEVWLEFYIWGGCQKLPKKKKNLATLFYFLRCWIFAAVRAFSTCGERRLFCSFGAKASHGGGFSSAGLGSWECGLSSLDSQALGHWLSSCGTGAWLPHGMWDPPRTGIKPVSPALQADSLPLTHQGSPSKCFKTPSQIES